MNVFLPSIGFGVVTASVLALCAVGLTLQFGITNFINFAYGQYLTIGAYTTWVATTSLHWNIWLAVLAGSVCVSVCSVLINRFVLSQFVRRGTPQLFLLIVTLGISFVLANLILAIWGAEYRRLDLSAPPMSIGPWTLTSLQLITIGIAVVAMLAIHFLLTRTKVGKAMRAVSDEPDLARGSGIDTDQVITLTWAIAGFLAGLAGSLLALDLAIVVPTMGADFLFVIFAAVIVGGRGQPYGAMLGAVLIGLITEMSASVLDSAYKNDVAYIALVLMLLLRPQGLIPARGSV